MRLVSDRQPHRAVEGVGPTGVDSSFRKLLGSIWVYSCLLTSTDTRLVSTDIRSRDMSHGGRYVNHSRLWANTRITSFTVDSPWKPGEEVPTGAVYIMTTKDVKGGLRVPDRLRGDGYWSDTLSTGFSLQPEELLDHD